MPAAARNIDATTQAPTLHLALEQGGKQWQLGFTTGPGRAPRFWKIEAGNLPRLEREIEAAKRRLDLPAEAQLVSCYEADQEPERSHFA